MRQIAFLAAMGLGMVGTAEPAVAQQWYYTVPVPSTSLNGDASGTITATGTFQKVFGAAANSPAPVAGSAGTRKGCVVQNNSTNIMYVNEGTPIGSATTSNTWTVAAGATFNCNFGGVVLTGEIDVTGTTGGAFTAKQF